MAQAQKSDRLTTHLGRKIDTYMHSGTPSRTSLPEPIVFSSSRCLALSVLVPLGPRFSRRRIYSFPAPLSKRTFGPLSRSFRQLAVSPLFLSTRGTSRRSWRSTPLICLVLVSSVPPSDSVVRCHQAYSCFLSVTPVATASILPDALFWLLRARRVPGQGNSSPFSVPICKNTARNPQRAPS